MRPFLRTSRQPASACIPGFELLPVSDASRAQAKSAHHPDSQAINHRAQRKPRESVGHFGSTVRRTCPQTTSASCRRLLQLHPRWWWTGTKRHTAMGYPTDPSPADGGGMWGDPADPLAHWARRRTRETATLSRRRIRRARRPVPELPRRNHGSGERRLAAHHRGSYSSHSSTRLRLLGSKSWSRAQAHDPDREALALVAGSVPRCRRATYLVGWSRPATSELVRPGYQARRSRTRCGLEPGLPWPRALWMALVTSR
jgi:hypothetical protein